ncbi:MAG: Gfo/Idh/MocA family oxidoreductase [Clostridiales Family XIII bacterium]|jgi:predicted dehydrogenase|nr:Gfo/Idh/MocA family oxidoreductase [Clostridiales Family XIII bacterium]
MADRLKYGMIGGGPGAFIGAVHRAAIRLNDEADIVAWAPSSRLGAGHIAAGGAMGIAEDRIYASFEAMAAAEGAREDKIDWVVVVTPNKYHAPAAKLFLEQGINVVCEKPLCTTVEEALDLTETAKANDCLFAVTYTYTGHVMAREARQLVRNGVIGDIRMVMGEYPQDWLLDTLETITEDNKPWRADPALSGRGAAVADLGTHIENWVNYVTGLKIDSLACHLDVFGEGGVLDNNVEALIRFENGATGIYWTSQVAIGFDNALKIRIFGDKGTIEFVQEENNYLKLSLRGEPPRIYSRGAGYLTPEASGYVRVPTGHPEGLTEAFANIYKDFAAAVKDKKAGKHVVESDYGYPTLDMGLAGVEFFNKCVDSSEAGAVWVKVDY